MQTRTVRTAKNKTQAPRTPVKSATKRRPSRGPSFGKWARRVSGMMKDAPPDLSMREGFGN